jgi:SPP1 family predicted phage head-tail adaptor
MIDCEIVLISKEVTGQDALAQDITRDVRVSVLATEIPVSRSEFFAAGQLGIKPEYEFIIHPADYSGQTEIEITRDQKTVRLKVYRTYESSPDELELYCEQAVGLN